MTKGQKALGWISITITALLLLLAALSLKAHAATWRTSQAKGEYRCLGSGSQGGHQYVWMAALTLAGKGKGSMDHGVVSEVGNAQEESVTGSYSVASSGVLSFEATDGSAYMVGPLVQAGRGILLSVDLWGKDQLLFHFSASCWK